MIKNIKLFILTKNSVLRIILNSIFFSQYRMLFSPSKAGKDRIFVGCPLGLTLMTSLEKS